VGKAHSDGDLIMYVAPDGVLFSGDIIFDGRLPYIGNGDTKHWLEVLGRMDREKLVALVPGHGSVTKQPAEAISQTRRYLTFLRAQMAQAVARLEPFDAAYAHTDWSEYRNVPAFDEANRRNAYQVYLEMEAESLDGTQHNARKQPGAPRRKAQ
jgi:glyoxylase-like metal-dependent hydrolase (beta-lactamase superfamily II)